MYNVITTREKHLTKYNNHKEEKGMKYASISNSEKFWEVIYASIMLEGKEREDALNRLQVPANPSAAA